MGFGDGSVMVGALMSACFNRCDALAWWCSQDYHHHRRSAYVDD